MRGGDDTGLWRSFRDALSHVWAVVVLIGVAVLFLGGAAAGTLMIDRLGSIGLAMYVVALVSYGLLFVPLVVYAVGLRQRGSRRYREELQRKQDFEQRRYGGQRTTRRKI